MYNIINQKINDANIENRTVDLNSLIFDGFENPADIKFHYENIYEILS